MPKASATLPVTGSAQRHVNARIRAARRRGST